MAFGLFKRKSIADRIFVNGNIITLDSEMPRALAVAVKDGKILDIFEDDSYKNVAGPQTDIVDLEGRYMVPGFIDAFSNPADKSFEGLYLTLNEDMDEDSIANEIDAYLKAEEREFVLALGASSAVFRHEIKKNEDMENSDTSDTPKKTASEITEPENENGCPKDEVTELSDVEIDKSEETDSERIEEAQKVNAHSLRTKLDEIAPDKPVIVVCADGLRMILNSCCMDTVKKIAEDDISGPITPSYVLNCIVSLDYDKRIGKYFEIAEEYAKYGFTCLAGLCSYNYFDKLYRDLQIDAYSMGLIKQRFMGTLNLKTMLNPVSALYNMDIAKTSCLELGGLVDYNSFIVTASSDKASDSYMSVRYLEEFTDTAGDKSYGVRMIPLDRQMALNSLDILGNVSEKYKKLNYMLISPYDFTDEELSSVFTGDVSIVQTDENKRANSFEYLTVVAANRIGLKDWAGTITLGKNADFAIFDADPQNEELPGFRGNLKAYMTVLNGEIVYGPGCGTAKEWAEELSSRLEEFENETEFSENDIENDTQE